MKTNPNAPAYPLSTEELSDRFHEGITLETGFTKREEFAKAAMQGILSTTNRDNGFLKKEDFYLVLDIEKITSVSVQLADALIAELNKEV